jgi:arabinose-5-phosphate isomerase
MCIENLVKQQHIEVNKFFTNINVAIVQKMIDIFMESNGDIYFCGLGKNETIINHLISVLKSISIKTNYLSPTNCLHGDIGIINSNDIIIFISKSGNTKELVDIVPYLKKRTINLYSIVCNSNCKLSNYCKDMIILPCGEELGSNFNLIPTTSILSYIIFSNILVIGLVEKQKLLLTEYGKNHPSGSIGRKISLIASDIMIYGDNLPLIDGNTTILDAFLMMTSKSLGLVIIVDNSKLIGIITDGDIRRYIMNNPDVIIQNIIAANIMNSNPKYFHHSEKLDIILNQIQKNKSLLSGVPIVDDNDNLCGLITHVELF